MLRAMLNIAHVSTHIMNMDLGEHKRTVASTYIQLFLIICGIYGCWRTLVNGELAERGGFEPPKRIVSV